MCVRIGYEYDPLEFYNIGVFCYCVSYFFVIGSFKGVLGL